MRMIAAAATMMLPLTAGAAQPRVEPEPRIEAAAERAAPASCGPFARTRHAGGAGAAVLQEPPSRARRLGELPAGDLSLTVQRSVNGCVEPVVVREGYGAFAHRPAQGGRRR